MVSVSVRGKFIAETGERHIVNLIGVVPFPRDARALERCRGIAHAEHAEAQIRRHANAG